MKQQPKFEMHNLVVLCGPSGAGKSTLAKELAEKVRSFGLTSTVISSDELRRELLGDSTLDNESPELLEVSDPAFRLLEAKVQSHMSYPVNTNFVIVDSTAMQEEFRKYLIEKGTQAGYSVSLIVLCYTHLKSDDFRASIARTQLKRIKETVMPNLGRRAFDNALTFTKVSQLNEFMDQFGPEQLPKLQLFKDCHLTVSKESELWAVGDVHECHEGLKALVDKLPSLKENQGILIGDILDEKMLTPEPQRTERLSKTLDLVQSLLDQGVKLVLGNHERYCAMRLLNKYDKADIEETFFNSLKPLQDNPDLAEKFMAIYNRALPFIKVKLETEAGFRTVYFTHSPCEQVHLGKLSSEAIKAQVNLRVVAQKDVEAERAELSFVKTQSLRQSQPHHVFGHVAVAGNAPLNMKVSHWIDSGAASGHSLSAVVFKGLKHRYESVSTSEVYGGKTEPVLELIKPQSLTPELPEILETRYELDETDQALVQKVIKGRARFISGTMAPAPSKGLDLECLDSAIEMFAQAGVSEVVAQPKYMGSRCQAYLNAVNPEESFFVSRNGLEIRHVPQLSELAIELIEKFKKTELNPKTELVLDGELMPWAALGEKLIDNDFKAYAVCVKEHLNFLENDEQFASFENLKDFDVQAHRQMLDVFNRQIELYGQPAPMEYKAFSILSLDGQVMTGEHQGDVFKLINKDPCVIANPQTEEGKTAIKEFFDRCTTDNNMEGIVLKPTRAEKEGVPPYMKVRNKDYLTLIYGYDYTQRLSKLCATKFVKGKAKLAYIEYKLGELMLTHPEHRTKLIYAMFGSIAKERVLDPRL